jgi:hypothetical protein
MNYYTIFHIDQHPDAGTAFVPHATKLELQQNHHV